VASLPEVYIKPPRDARNVARAALEIRESLPPSRRGGLDPSEAEAQGIISGVTQARKIARGDRMDVRPIYRFFKRHMRHILTAEERGLGPEASKAAMSAWLWGGWPMYEAVTEAIRKNQ